MKNRIYLFTAILICISVQLKAQTNTFPLSGSVGVGTLSPNGSAAVEVVSTTQGLLAPRMTKVQRDAIVAPATGLLIFQTNATPGFYFYTGAAWTTLACYFSMVVMSFIIGQKHYHVPYNLRKIIAYLLVSIVLCLFGLGLYNTLDNYILSFVIRLILVILFFVFAWWLDISKLVRSKPN